MCVLRVYVYVYVRVCGCVVGEVCDALSAFTSAKPPAAHHTPPHHTTTTTYSESNASSRWRVLPPYAAGVKNTPDPSLPLPMNAVRR